MSLKILPKSLCSAVILQKGILEANDKRHLSMPLKRLDRDQMRGMNNDASIFTIHKEKIISVSILLRSWRRIHILYLVMQAYSRIDKTPRRDDGPTRSEAPERKGKYSVATLSHTWSSVVRIMNHV